MLITIYPFIYKQNEKMCTSFFSKENPQSLMNNTGKSTELKNGKRKDIPSP